jgi:hypothetical protein
VDSPKEKGSRVATQKSEGYLDQILVKCVPLAVINDLAEKASGDKKLFSHLATLSLKPPHTRAAKASWALSKAAALAPAMIVPWQEKILEAIPHAATGGIKRELLKSILYSSLHKQGSGRLFDVCLSLLDPKEDKGVVHYAMEHLERMVKYHPDLKDELAGSVRLFRSKSPGNLPYRIRVFRY